MSTAPRTDEPRGSRPRIPLNRARVLRAAVDVADRDGLSALTMRRLAQELDVEAMSLYHHVANKQAILDGVVEVVIDEILDAVNDLDAPAPAEDWRGAMRARILTARQVFLRHPWAPRVLESRTGMTVGYAVYFDGLLAILRAGGFSYDTAHHALHVLGSRALGFTQELFEPDDAADEDDSTAELARMADRVPHLMAMMSEIAHDDPHSTLGWCDDQFEFEFGLDLILDGLERHRGRS